MICVPDAKATAPKPGRLRAAVRISIAAIASLVVVVVGALGFFTFTAFDPPPSLELEPLGTAENRAPRELSLLTWNIGYAGLDRDADFFMDGGRMAGPRSQQAVEQNLSAIRSELLKHAPDVLLLQEVDRAASRTWDTDQVEALTTAFPAHQGWYGVNFRSPFVPVPPASPIGRVESGVLTLLSSAATAATREQLPGSFGWPVRLFHLKRCAVFARVPSATQGKDWILVNLHLSAFDDGSLRQQQSAFLGKRMRELYEQGHYVVLGGDWNLVLPGVDSTTFGPSTTSAENLAWLQSLPGDWTPEGWTWAMDPSVPTVRTNDQPYRPGENHRTVIDGFLLSPNIRLDEVKGIELGFAHSDHQPVVARVSIRE
jgi:endonuclease/exonuclease/phosphatase family metal-dependent hydrolase